MTYSSPQQVMPIAIPMWSRFGIGVHMHSQIDSNFGFNAWPEANRAIFIPFSLPAPFTARFLTQATGNMVSAYGDMGIYRPDGSLIVSGGPKALGTATVVQFYDIADTYLAAGRYYLAVSVNRVGAGGSNGLAVADTSLNLFFCKTFGMAQLANAFPLPTNVVGYRSEVLLGAGDIGHEPAPSVGVGDPDEEATQMTPGLTAITSAYIPAIGMLSRADAV